MEKEIHILLADDDKDDVFFFKRALKEITIPYRFTYSEDGEKLMQYLNTTISDLPDVIFLDLNMPRKTGTACLEEIKSSEKLKHIPIVIYSTSYLPEVADVLYEKGAHYYMQKCDFLELPKEIKKALKLLLANPSKPSREQFVVNEKTTV